MRERRWPRWRKRVAAIALAAMGMAALDLGEVVGAGDATGFGDAGLQSLTSTDNLLTVTRPNGNVVAVGAQIYSKVVAREWRADGTPEPGFGANGQASLQVPGSTNQDDGTRIYEAHGLRLLADGRALVVFSRSGGTSLAMLTPSGGFDAAFGGGDGYVTDSHCGNVTDVLVDPADGAIATVAYGNGECEGTTVRRYDAAGNRLTSWGNQQVSGGHRDGRVYANAATLDAAGNIVVAGQSNDSRYGVLRITKAGAADTTFGQSGFAGVDPSPGQGSEYFGWETGFPAFFTSKFATSVAVDRAGGILVTGNSRAAAGQDLDIVTTRFLSTGALDTTYGTSGRSVIDSAADRDDYPMATAIDAQDRLVVTGSSRSGSDRRLQFVARLGPDGAKDTSIDPAGSVTSSFGTGHAFVPFGISLSGTGRAYVSGSYIEAGTGWVRGYVSAIDLLGGGATTTTTSSTTTTTGPTTSTTAPTTTTTAPPAGGPSAPAGAVRVVGDFDGDGRDDVLWYRAGTAADLLWRSTASGFTTTAVAMDEVAEPSVGDFDGDGRDDVLWYQSGASSLTLWSGTAAGGFVTSTLAVTPS